jgi:F-type H+-transporting ATPase subunit epsilon
MTCDIVTPESMLYSGEVTFVSAPAAEGEIGVMYQCSPLMSTLKRGEIKIKPVGDAEASLSFAVAGGYVEADGYRVVVLANRAINVAEIDVQVSQERIAANEQRLAELGEDDSRAVFVREEIAWQTHLTELASRK